MKQSEPNGSKYCLILFCSLPPTKVMVLLIFGQNLS